MSLSRKIIFLSIALYIASLPQVCFETQNLDKRDIYLGWQLLIVGAFSFIVGYYYWFANLFYLLCLIFFFKKIQQEKIFSFSLISIVIAVSFYFCESIPANESGHTYIPIIGLYGGYYCWLSAMIVSFIGICISLTKYDIK